MSYPILSGPPGTRLPPVVFTEADALGLVMTVLDGQSAAADTDDPVGAGLGKAIRALPENAGRQAAALREHASAAPDRYPARPDPATTARWSRPSRPGAACCSGTAASPAANGSPR